MKKMIMILGYVFLIVIVLIAAGVASVTVLGRRLDKESKAFVDAAAPAIAANWDLAELQKRASPEFDESVDYDDLAEDFDTLRQLGTLVEYKGSTGESNITVSLSGYEITADYAAYVDFEEGSTEIRISLIKRRGRWQILDFTVNPDTHPERRDII